MFSGIIAEVGLVQSATRKGDVVSFRITAPVLSSDLEAGDSVAVNGVCQTVTSAGADTFTFDSVAQTLKTTNLSDLVRGSSVNIEPALRLGDRVSGHLVSGHVDSTGIVRSRRTKGARNVDFTIQIPEDLEVYVHERGSIALDGVSLTVKGARGSMVEVTVIPYTLDSTILKAWRAGTRVNVEVDQIARYVISGLRPKGGGQV